MIKLPVLQEIDPDIPDWPPDAQFEYNRFGVKIMIWPKNGQWVKDCLTGEPIRKENAVIFRRDDRDNFYYLRKDNTEDVEGLVDLIPSRWDEDK